MNKRSNLIFIAAVFAVFGVVNAQEATTPVAEPTTQAPVTHPVEHAPVVHPTEHAPVTHPTVHAPAAQEAPVAVPVAQEAQTPVAEPVVAAPATVEPAPVADSVQQVAQAVKIDSGTVVLIVKDPKPKKKRRGSRAPKNDFAIVDVPANFEIQARKVMPVDSDWGNDNLDTWWGRANLMVLTESENFVGKVHLRMYPGEFGSATQRTANNEKTPANEKVDQFQLYEAWAWHRGDYVNIKIGRWDNTTRFGSKNFGGYIDAKKDLDTLNRNPNRNRRQSGFMSTYYPENAVQFGLNNFSENISLDIALVSSDNKLNNGDLRIYFQFKELAGLENMNIGVGYRSNVFDEIFSKYGDVTHTVDLAVRMPVVKDIGILKDFSVFIETALIGLDDQKGILDMIDEENKRTNRRDEGGIPGKYNPAFPVLGGLDFSLYRGFDKIVVEAEYDGKRRNSLTGGTEHVRDIQGSIYVQKALNDRFTLNLGVQSENNTKDFSFAGRLQGRIN